MHYVHCRVKHDPEAGTYGDCIRACVASIVEMQAEAVPHFAEDNPGPMVANQRLSDWLLTQNLAPFWSHYDGSATLEQVLHFQGLQNPTAVYMLFGRTGTESDHVVICRGGEIVHDPAWYRSPIIGPGSHGEWSVMVICRI